MTRELPESAARLLERFSDDVVEIALSLRDRVFSLMPAAHEIVYDAGYTVSLHYGPDDELRNAVLYIASYSKHANLGFFAGAMLPDPQRVLEGSGSRMRHVKFKSVAEVSAPWCVDYINASLAHAGLSPALGDNTTTVRHRGAGKSTSSSDRLPRPAGRRRRR
jgi:hypothetical protein